MPTVRAFIAIQLHTDVLARIGQVQDQLKREVPPGVVRWVRPGGIHLTLKFLGEVPTTAVGDISVAMKGACGPHAPFALSIGGMGCFPNPYRPRVIWVGIDEPSGALTRLQQDIERAVEPLGFPPEGRPFHPHLTLGRVKGRDRAALHTLGDRICSASVDLGRMEVASVHLIRSQLLPGGAVYNDLAVAPLDAE
jgi:2'-5' RNA ligase